MVSRMETNNNKLQIFLGMRYRKVYGQSREETCMFCDKPATTENSQGLPSCKLHIKELLADRKCVCGEYMDIKKGKFGAFFLCANCGPVSIKKSEEMENGDYKLNKKFRKQQKTKYIPKEKLSEEKPKETPKEPQKKEAPPEEKIYTLEELKKLW